MALCRNKLQAKGQKPNNKTKKQIAFQCGFKGEALSVRLTDPVVCKGRYFRRESRTGRKKASKHQKTKGASHLFRGAGRGEILTAPADVNEQIALEDGAALEHLSGSH